METLTKKKRRPAAFCANLILLTWLMGFASVVVGAGAVVGIELGYEFIEFLMLETP